MKRNKSSMKHGWTAAKKRVLAGAAVLFAATGLSSCQSALYDAAAQGDLSAVRTEIAKGAKVDGGSSGANVIWKAPCYLVTVPVDIAQATLSACTLGFYPWAMTEAGIENPLLTPRVMDYGKQTPVEAAWENGHLSVVDALADAGALAAPASVAGRTLTLESQWVENAGAGVRTSASAPELHDANKLVSIDKYWAEEVQWQQLTSDNVRALAWGDSNVNERKKSYPAKRIKRVVYRDGGEGSTVTYKRTGLKTAEVTKFDWVRPHGGEMDWSVEKYELTFETPTTGSFRCVTVKNPTTVSQSKGRFWLSAAPVVNQ